MSTYQFMCTHLYTYWYKMYISAPRCKIFAYVLVYIYTYTYLYIYIYTHVHKYTMQVYSHGYQMCIGIGAAVLMAIGTHTGTHDARSTRQNCKGRRFKKADRHAHCRVGGETRHPNHRWRDDRHRRVMSHIILSCVMSYMKKSCRQYAYDMSHLWMSRVVCEETASRTWRWHVAHVNDDDARFY